MKNKILSIALLLGISLVLISCEKNEEVSNKTSYEAVIDESVVDILEDEPKSVVLITQIPEETDYTEETQEINELQEYYAEVISLEDNIVIDFPLGIYNLDVKDTSNIENINVGDYLYFTNEDIITLADTIELKKCEIASNFDAEDYFSQNNREYFKPPYEDEESNSVIFQAEIIRKYSSPDDTSSYLTYTNEGLIIFSEKGTDYKKGDLVNFYTNGLIMESYPAQCSEVFYSELIEL